MALLLIACTRVDELADRGDIPDETSLPVATVNTTDNRPANDATSISNAKATTDLPSPDPTVNTDQPPKINRRVDVPDDLRVRWLIPWDGIQPIYKPEFAQASEAPLKDDELIIGVAWEGEAKAYPISVLRTREMVNDELAGIPTLVTW